MTLSDLILKAKVNMALVRDPRVSALDIRVTPHQGVVTLNGDVDSEAQCQAVIEIARGVEGVVRVDSALTTSVGREEETAERIVQLLLKRLDDAWNSLPDQNALTQADYLRWALWLVYKFHLPDTLESEERARLSAHAVEGALTQIAGHMKIPKSLVALQMLRQVEELGAHETPLSLP